MAGKCRSGKVWGSTDSNSVFQCAFRRDQCSLNHGIRGFKLFEFRVRGVLKNVFCLEMKHAMLACPCSRHKVQHLCLTIVVSVCNVQRGIEVIQ